MKLTMALSLVLCCSIAFATTFLPQSLDDLDRKADYIVIGKVVGQEGILENKTIMTQTTIDVEEWLKGFSLADTLVVNELGGLAGDVMMVVPGSPKFEDGERVALFVTGDKPTRWWNPVAGHTVGMAQGKFSIKTDEDDEEVLISDLGGAHMLVEGNSKPILLKEFRARFRQGIFYSIMSWLKVIL